VPPNLVTCLSSYSMRWASYIRASPVTELTRAPRAGFLARVSSPTAANLERLVRQVSVRLQRWGVPSRLGMVNLVPRTRPGVGDGLLVGCAN
jgi:hypothetical protein